MRVQELPAALSLIFVAAANLLAKGKGVFAGAEIPMQLQREGSWCPFTAGLTSLCLARAFSAAAMKRRDPTCDAAAIPLALLEQMVSLVKARLEATLSDML